MKRIHLLTDYKNQFGSKWGSNPYRSGFDLELLKNIFYDFQYSVRIVEMSETQKLDKIEGGIFLYTSSEDIGYYYKSYIEDVILYLELNGAVVVPGFKYLRANNNKSFMELIRKKFDFEGIHTLKSYSFGTLDELKNISSTLTYPVVLKKSSGAMSKGVFLANNEEQLVKLAKKISRTKHYLEESKDFLRLYKHKDYKSDSKYRNKFVIQEYIPELKNDWKVLVYYDKIFVLERGVPSNDFRASGSKFNYLAGSNTKLPDGFLDFVYNVRKEFNVPNIALDIVYDGACFHVIEYQAIYFGTSTFNMSDIYYEKDSNGWTQKNNDAQIEKYYSESIISYLNKP